MDDWTPNLLASPELENEIDEYEVGVTKDARPFKERKD